MMMLATSVFHTIEAGKHVTEYLKENVSLTNHQKKEDTMETVKTKSANQIENKSLVQTSTQSGYHSL